MCLVMREMHVMQENDYSASWSGSHIIRLNGGKEDPSCKAPIRFLKDNNFRANDRGSFEMTVKYSIYRKTKYVHVFDVPNHVCTGFDPVISRRENCHKHVQHMCLGKVQRVKTLWTLRHQPFVRQENHPKMSHSAWFRTPPRPDWLLTTSFKKPFVKLSPSCSGGRGVWAEQPAELKKRNGRT